MEIGGLFWLNSINFLIWRLVRGVPPILFFSTLENFSMKKTLIALAAVAVSSAAMAQVTITGSIGFGFESLNTAGTKTSGYGFDDSEVRFSFAEDLGGGLKASGSMTIDNLIDGSGTTGAKGDGAVLSLSGGFGTVSFTNVGSSDYLPVDSVTTDSETFSMTTDRVTYVSPTFNGFKVTLIDADGDNAYTKATTATEGANSIVMLDYAAGPLTANFMSQSHKNSPATTAVQGRTGYKVGYNFGVAALTYAVLDTDRVTSADSKETALTVSVPMGAMTASFSMADHKDVGSTKLKGTQLDLSYALSKRTTIAFRNEVSDLSTTTEYNQKLLTMYHSF
ncbi:OmpC Outer membrane protein (porin) [Burkholderiaceae bacterium]